MIDSDGYFTMSGRKKEIIIRGGLNVAPREVEELIATMSQVHEVAVIGLPDARLGEIGCACVVPVPGQSISLNEIVEYLRAEGLAPFKLPERLIVLDELPRTATGKIQKFHLAKQAISENENPNTESAPR